MPNGRKPRRRTGTESSGGGPLTSVENWTFRTAGKAVFLFVFGAFIFVGLASDLVFLSALAGIAVFVWGSIVLPTSAFKRTGKYLWSGEAGADAHRKYCEWMPGRGGGRR
jgi:hypothetical protein